MNATDLPVCCGIKLLTGFGNTDTAIDNSKYTLQQIDTFLENRGNFEGYNPNMSMNMLVLNGDQRLLMKDLLKKHGFRCVASNYHRAHKTTLFVYIKKNKKK